MSCYFVLYWYIKASASDSSMLIRLTRRGVAKLIKLQDASHLKTGKDSWTHICFFRTSLSVSFSLSPFLYVCQSDTKKLLKAPSAPSPASSVIYPTFNACSKLFVIVAAAKLTVCRGPVLQGHDTASQNRSDLCSWDNTARGVSAGSNTTTSFTSQTLSLAALQNCS